MSEESMRILKIGKCPSLSGRSTLTYKIGCKDDKEVYLRLDSNTGQGVFNKDWISLMQLDSLLASEEKPITSGRLREMFKGKSCGVRDVHKIIKLCDGRHKKLIILWTSLVAPGGTVRWRLLSLKAVVEFLLEGRQIEETRGRRFGLHWFRPASVMIFSMLTETFK